MLSVLNFLLAITLVLVLCKYIDLKNKLKPREGRYLNLINAFSSIIDSIEGYNKSHADEVADFAIKIGKKTSMKEEQLASLELAARIHDMGMVIVNNDVLKSRRKLDDDDRFLMKNHTLLAEHYLKQKLDAGDELPSIIRWHHERWDGFGYPDSLQGEQIPLASRILAISDAVSAMRSPRHYRKKIYKTNKEVIYELERQSGLQFDPFIVKIAVSLLAEQVGNQ